MVKAYGLEDHLSILNIALNQLSAEKRAKITPLLSDILIFGDREQRGET
jgi:hypothetical protein